MNKKLTTDEFILKAKDIHGEKYLYKNSHQGQTVTYNVHLKLTNLLI